MPADCPAAALPPTHKEGAVPTPNPSSSVVALALGAGVSSPCFLAALSPACSRHVSGRGRAGQLMGEGEGRSLHPAPAEALASVVLPWGSRWGTPFTPVPPKVTGHPS